MAFTLLGTGTAVAKTINPKSDNNIVASAAYCNHVVGSSSARYGEWQFDHYKWNAGGLYFFDIYRYRTVKYYCTKCGDYLYSGTQHKIEHWDFGGNFHGEEYY